MKKIILFIAVALLSTIANAQEHKEYYENGQLKLVGFIEDGKRTGEWKSYHKNSQLASIGKAKHGKQTGEWKNYHENGQLSQIGKYENGKATGEWKNYHENGQLSTIRQYENGKKTGEVKSYHENGQLQQIGKHENGELTGEFKVYHENGQLIQIGQYQNGKKTGEWSFYFSNGQLEKKCTEDNRGVYNGNYVEYYENGELRFKGERVDYEKEGEWYQFEDGEKYKFLYENGELVKSKKVNSINDPIEDQFYKLNFKNKCNKKIELAIIFKNLDDEWETKGYFHIEPNEEVYLANTENRIYYYYAQTIGGKTTWTGDFKDTIHGNQHDFRKKTIPSDKAYGDQYTNLTFD